MNLTKKKILKYLFLFFLIFFAIFFWFNVNSLIDNTLWSSWSMTIFSFSMLFLFWGFLAFIFNTPKINWLISFCIFIPLFFFSFKSLGFLFIPISFILLFWGFHLVKLKMNNEIKINFGYIFRVSHKFFSLAISIAIISAFFIPNILEGNKKMFPKITLEEKYFVMAEHILSKINPKLSYSNIEKMTVDEYILKQSNSENLNQNLQQDVLSSGKKSISKMVNRPIKGDEKINAIFLEIINNRINDYFYTDIQRDEVSLGGWLLIGITFITLYSISLFLTSFLVVIIKIIFKIFLLLGILKINFKEVKKEIIE